MNKLEKKLEQIESVAFNKGIDIESGWFYQEIREELTGDYDEKILTEKLDALSRQINKL